MWEWEWEWMWCKGMVPASLPPSLPPSPHPVFSLCLSLSLSLSLSVAPTPSKTPFQRDQAAEKAMKAICKFVTPTHHPPSPLSLSLSLSLPLSPSLPLSLSLPTPWPGDRGSNESDALRKFRDDLGIHTPPRKGCLRTSLPSLGVPSCKSFFFIILSISSFTTPGCLLL